MRKRRIDSKHRCILLWKTASSQNSWQKKPRKNSPPVQSYTPSATHPSSGGRIFTYAARPPQQTNTKKNDTHTQTRKLVPTSGRVFPNQINFYYKLCIATRTNIHHRYGTYRYNQNQNENNNVVYVGATFHCCRYSSTSKYNVRQQQWRGLHMHLLIRLTSPPNRTKIATIALVLLVEVLRSLELELFPSVATHFTSIRGGVGSSSHAQHGISIAIDFVSATTHYTPCQIKFATPR